MIKQIQLQGAKLKQVDSHSSTYQQLETESIQMLDISIPLLLRAAQAKDTPLALHTMAVAGLGIIFEEASPLKTIGATYRPRVIQALAAAARDPNPKLSEIAAAVLLADGAPEVLPDQYNYLRSHGVMINDAWSEVSKAKSR